MIHEVNPGKTFSMGAATAGYEGYEAMAIGCSARVAENVKVKGGASLSGSQTALGVGMSCQ